MKLADDCESVLEHGMKIAEAVGGIDAVLKPMGQLFVRVGLFATGKEKSGQEGKVYTLVQIRSMFLDDLSLVVGKKVTYSEWGPEAPANRAPSDTAPTLAKKANVATLSDHNNPIWVAGQHGFTIGKMVVEKLADSSPTGLFTVFKIGDSIELHQVCSYNDAPAKVELSLQELVEKWTTTKVEPPIEMQGGQRRPKSLDIEKQKSIIFKAIVDLDAKHATKHELVFWRRPDEVRTGTSTIKKGQLVLIPVQPYMNITTKNTASGVGVSLGEYDIDGQDTEFFVVPPSGPAVDKDQFGADAIVSAFWWVCQTHDKKLVNVALDAATQNGVSVPLLKNTVDLPPWSKLWMIAPAKAKVVLTQLSHSAKGDVDKPVEKPAKK